MYLLRIALPDQPGTLGVVASALGAAGADILAVDVVSRAADGTAIDDFVVELPLGGRADSLVSACLAVSGVRVLWLSRYAAGGNLRHDLEAVEAMTEQPAEAERLLVRHAPVVFRADWALLVSRDRDTGRVVVPHATPAAPDLPGDEAPWLPLDRPVRLEIPAGWEDRGWRHVTAATTPLGSRHRALVIGRSGGPEILGSELARLAHLAGLSQTVLRTLGPEPDPVPDD